MQSQLYPLDPNAVQVKTTKSVSDNFYLVEGGEISWVEVQPKSATTFNTSATSHLWSLLGLYSESDAVKFGITKSNGGYSDTAIRNIYTAYNSTGLLIGSVDSNAFRASFYPNLRVTIPISGGTGTLSGLTSLNLYSAFFEQPDSTSCDGSGPCAGWLVDSLYSESHQLSTHKAGIGYAYDGVNNPSATHTDGQYQSGVMHLFAEELYFSGNTGTTWSTGWSGSSRYTFGNSPLGKFDGTTQNRGVGIMFLDSGLICLYDQEIVSSFNTGVATGGTITTGLTFPTTECKLVGKDIDVSTFLEINVALYPNQFVQSNNSSLLDARKADVDCNGRVGITEVCLYDSNGLLTAKGQLSVPTWKEEKDFTLLKGTLSLDGGVKTLEGRTTY